LLTTGKKDVLIALGVVEVPKAGLGLEAAGIIRSIGPEVTDLSVGDRVILLGTGCFSTSTTVSEQLCAKMPDDLSFEDGATMPCVYGTAIYSLIEVGRLEKGQVSGPSITLRSA
jgi:NADPH:quinone reductase-like Zn-dependent oxidoreductase